MMQHVYVNLQSKENVFGGNHPDVFSLEIVIVKSFRQTQLVYYD